MARIKVFEEFIPLNTPPRSDAPVNPKIDTTPDLDDEEVEISWRSPSYIGHWFLSGPKRSLDEASVVARQMKMAETGSEPVIERLQPIDVFISTFARQLNPHGWTIDFEPEDDIA